ncbi:MAG: glucose-6-phosphate dehydrogenase assembly protein OpcA [Verrucomicrobiales bacterium]
MLEVPISAISRELKRLWEGDASRTRASLINFAVYSEAEESLAENTALVEAIAREHACRALVIEARQGGDPSARAWLTAHCHLEGGKKTICSEQLSFVLHGGSGSLLRNLVFAHLDSDLPLVFWWRGELSAAFEERLYRRIDRLVVDSFGWPDPGSAFGRIAEALASSKRMVFHDLAWTRAMPMRLALAKLFEDPAATAAAPALDRLAITHAPGHRTSALMLAAWIARSLRWEPQGGGRFLRQEGGGAELSVTESADPSCHPVEAVALSGGGCEFALGKRAEARDLSPPKVAAAAPVPSIWHPASAA